MAEFRMPAEWEPHIRTWMCWPCRAEAWDDMAAAKRAYAEVARAIAKFEPVLMAANPADAGEAADMTGVEIFPVDIDDSWARDIGPTFVGDIAGDRAAIHWRFNAWGGKYAPFDRDARFASHAGAKARVPVHPASIICEGGAIHSDGQGTLLTTEQCLLNPNRNPGLTRTVAEQVLHYAVGAERVVWLGDGFSDDETDGHVDNIACFAGAGPKAKVVLGVPDSANHPDTAAIRIARARLKAAGLDVIELLQPRTIRRDARGRLLQASYVNFYLCNGGLIMPSFDDPHDVRARDTLAAAFPGRDITVVPALPIVAGGGGIHCITQQEPE
jgi:agmatine deiminase